MYKVWIVRFTEAFKHDKHVQEIILRLDLHRMPHVSVLRAHAVARRLRGDHAVSRPRWQSIFHCIDIEYLLVAYHKVVHPRQSTFEKKCITVQLKLGDMGKPRPRKKPASNTLDKGEKALKLHKFKKVKTTGDEGKARAKAQRSVWGVVGLLAGLSSLFFWVTSQKRKQKQVRDKTVLSNLLRKPLSYTEHAACRMECRWTYFFVAIWVFERIVNLI